MGKVNDGQPKFGAVLDATGGTEGWENYTGTEAALDLIGRLEDAMVRLAEVESAYTIQRERLLCLLGKVSHERLRRELLSIIGSCPSCGGTRLTMMFVERECVCQECGLVSTNRHVFGDGGV